MSIATVLGTSMATADDKPTSITIATEGAYAPWNLTTSDGKPGGFEVDLAMELCKRMNVKCTVVLQDWDGLIPALNAGKYDAIMAAMFITDKRLEVINFSRPYAVDPSSFAAAKDSAIAKAGLDGTIDLDNEAAAMPTIDKMKAALKGTTIGVQAATKHLDFVKKYFSDVATIREYKTTQEHDLDLAAGRVDSIFAQRTTLAATLSKPDFANYTVAGPGFVKGVFGKGTGVGIRKKDTELVAMFNDAIASAIADGTIKKMSLEVMKSDVTPPQ
jgi:octopine/nopaline transport system substrate-binding protein